MFPKYFAVLQALEVLPVAAAPEPRQLTEEEVKHLEEQEEDTLRELRIFLRNVTHRLAIDKRFRVFTKPVDLHEVKGFISCAFQAIGLKTPDTLLGTSSVTLLTNIN